MIPLSYHLHRSVRLLLVAVVFSILVLDLGGPQTAIAQSTSITLQDAIAQNQVEVSNVVGNRTQDERSFYAQPMLLATLRNLTAEQLVLELPAGTRIRSTSGSSDLLAVGFAQPQLLLEPNETRENVGIEALLLRVEAFPANDQVFELGAVTTDETELAAIGVITERGGYGSTDVTQQLALWRIANGLDCSQLDLELVDVLGIGLGCDNAIAENVEKLVTAIGREQAAPPVDGNMLLLVIVGVALLVPAAGFLLLRGRRGTANSQEQSPTPAATGGGGTARVQSEPLAEAGRVKGDGRRPNIKTAPLPPPPESSKASVSTSPLPVSPAQSEAPSGSRIAQITTPAPARQAVQTTPAHRQAYDTGTYLPQDAPIRELPDELLKPRILLALQSGEVSNKSITITNEVMISRDEVYQTVIDDASISTPHCFIRFVRGAWQIRDLFSRNGTQVKGVGIGEAKNHPLNSGDEVKMGGLQFTFSGDSSGDRALLTASDGNRYEFISDTSPYWLLTSRKLPTEIVANNGISVPHAIISFEDGWRIRDLNSTSGTYIERSRKEIQLKRDPRQLMLNDRILFSNRVIYLCAPVELPSIDPYRLTEWAGQGGLASVFRATQGSADKADLAVKLLREQTTNNIRTFEHECRLLEELHRKGTAGIVPYVSHGEDSKYGPYLVLQYIDGATLATIMRLRQEAFDKQTAVALTLQVCEAVAVLHNAGYIHCDIKPANILLDQQGNVYLADFGAVTREGEEVEFGTSGYVPVQDDRIARPQRDVYSLSVVLYEMINAKLPSTIGGRQRRHRETTTFSDQSSDLDVYLEPVFVSDPTTQQYTIAGFAAVLKQAVPVQNSNNLLQKLVRETLLHR